jgi:CRISPR-associated exonuclease Cas4
MITATDIKQYIFCPRTVYLYHVLHIPSRFSQKMQKGQKVHEEIERMNHLPNSAGTPRFIIFHNQDLDSDRATRYFSLPLESSSLGLRGVLDLLVATASGRKMREELIPVDFKFGPTYSGGAHKSHRFQLAAYALLVEESFRKDVRRGYIHYIPENASVKVDFKDDLKNSTLQMIREINEMLREEKEPERAENPSKCADCSYRRFCEGTRA